MSGTINSFLVYTTNNALMFNLRTCYTRLTATLGCENEQQMTQKLIGDDVSEYRVQYDV